MDYLTLSHPYVLSQEACLQGKYNQNSYATFQGELHLHPENVAVLHHIRAKIGTLVTTGPGFGQHWQP